MYEPPKIEKIVSARDFQREAQMAVAPTSKT